MRYAAPSADADSTKYQHASDSSEPASPENELRGNNTDLATSPKGQVFASSGVAQRADLMTR
jgi:hypothetical protein